MKKKAFVSTILLLSTMALAACGTNTETADSTSTSEISAVSAEPTGEKIVLYTNNGSDGRSEWLQAASEEAGFNVEIVSLGGGDLTARAISEANNPLADIIWGPSEAQFSEIKATDQLASFTPEWASELEAGTFEEDNLSYPYEVQPKIMIVNSEVYTQESAPTDYTDLWEKEAFHGKYAVPTDFGGTTNRAIIAGILTRYLDEDGEHGVSEEGWDAIAAYFDNGYKTPEGENDFENLVSAKVPVTFTFASGLKGKQDAFQHEALVVVPEIGLPTNTNHIGVVDKEDEAIQEEAERFVNWLGSTETIGEYAAEYGILPTNQSAVEFASPQMKELAETMTVQDIDWEFVNAHIEDWIAKIQLEIY